MCCLSTQNVAGESPRDDRQLLMPKGRPKARNKRPEWADRLEAARTIRFASQAEFARHLNLSISRYGNYEQGIREPDYETLCKIADALNISIDWLLSGKVKHSLNVQHSAA